MNDFKLPSLEELDIELEESYEDFSLPSLDEEDPDGEMPSLYSLPKEELQDVDIMYTEDMEDGVNNIDELDTEQYLNEAIYGVDEEEVLEEIPNQLLPGIDFEEEPEEEEEEKPNKLKDLINGVREEWAEARKSKQPKKAKSLRPSTKKKFPIGKILTPIIIVLAFLLVLTFGYKFLSSGKGYNNLQGVILEDTDVTLEITGASIVEDELVLSVKNIGDMTADFVVSGSARNSMFSKKEECNSGVHVLEIDKEADIGLTCKITEESTVELEVRENR